MFSATWTEELLAIGEIAGRHVVGRIPAVRQRAKQSVRQTSGPAEPVSLGALRERILSLGYQPGRDLLVHSAWASLRQVEAELDEIVSMLQELVGPRANLLMPSHPVLVQRRGLPVYDPAKSRSRVGLLTERFRKTPGVLRSPFPVAPALVAGPDAELYTRDFRQESGGTPYGRGSPYFELTQRDGQVLYLGIDFIRTLTLEHVAFDVLQGDHPVKDYYDQETFLVVRGGREEKWTVRFQRKALEPWLASIAMKRMVLRSGTIRSEALGGLSVQVMDAGPFLDWHLPLARRRGWPYWTPPLPKRGRG